MDLTAFLGRFHPVVLHLPIGVLFTIALIEVWCFFRPRPDESEHRLLLLLYVFACAVSLVSIATGLALHLEDGYGGDTLALHKWFGIAVGATTLLTTLLAYCVVKAKWEQLRRRVAIRFSGLVLCLVLMTVAGHSGGELTHGSGFLTEYAPAFLKNWGEANKAVASEATVYEAVIHPIFDTYCTSCHGDSKKKGGLAMHTVDAILDGGETDDLFIPGNPEESLMLIRIHLPEDDDDHMPPKKKRQLTGNRIDALTWWVAKGASFEMRISDPQVPETIRDLANVAE